MSSRTVCASCSGSEWRSEFVCDRCGVVALAASDNGWVGLSVHSQGESRGPESLLLCPTCWAGSGLHEDPTGEPTT